MDSKRERILKRFQTVLAGTDGIGGRVNRTLPDPNARDYTPYIALEWQNDNVSSEGTVLMERTLTVLVSIHTRGDEPDALADPIAISAHSLIVADTTLGGLAIDCTLRDVSFDAMGADGSAGRLTAEYAVKYRHSYGDLTA